MHRLPLCDVDIIGIKSFHNISLYLFCLTHFGLGRVIGEFNGGGKGGMPPNELGPPNKLQERLCGAYRMQENLLAAGAPP